MAKKNKISPKQRIDHFVLWLKEVKDTPKNTSFGAQKHK